MERKRKTGSSIRLLDNKIWREYKDKKKNKALEYDTREELKQVVKEICKVISEGVVEEKAGVLIRDFGYFFNWKIPKKMKYTLLTKDGIVEKYNFDTEGHMTVPVFFPSQKMNIWSMDATFNRSLKLKLKTKLLNGFKYFMYPYTLKQFL